MNDNGDWQAGEEGALAYLTSQAAAQQLRRAGRLTVAQGGARDGGEEHQNGQRHDGAEEGRQPVEVTLRVFDRELHGVRLHGFTLLRSRSSARIFSPLRDHSAS